MAATVADIDAKIDLANSTLATLQTEVDNTIARKDAELAAKDVEIAADAAQVVTLNDTIQTQTVLIAQLQAQIAAGGGAPDLQPQLDKLTTLVAGETATITVLQGA